MSLEAGEGQGSPSKTLLRPTLLPRRQSRPRILQRQGMSVRKQSLGPSYLQLNQKTPQKKKKPLKAWSWCLPLFPYPPKEDPKGKTQISTTAAATQPPKNQKDKFVIKMKQYVVFSFLSFFCFLVLPNFCNLLAFVRDPILMRLANPSFMILVSILLPN